MVFDQAIFLCPSVTCCASSAAIRSPIRFSGGQPNLRDPVLLFLLSGQSGNCQLLPSFRREGSTKAGARAPASLFLRSSLILGFCELSGRLFGPFPRPTQQNLCHFVAFIGSQKNNWWWLPNEPLRWPLRPALQADGWWLRNQCCEFQLFSKQLPTMRAALVMNVLICITVSECKIYYYKSNNLDFSF